MAEVQSSIERLVSLHPECEIWWDSSPLVYDAWQEKICGDTDASPVATEEVGRLWDAARPTAGLLRGSTTNPPLAWCANSDENVTEGQPVFR